MRGFILAAGFGTRLRPITDHLPKALVPLAGKPLLQHAIDFFHEHTISTIGVNTHYLADSITRFRLAQAGSFEVFHELPEIRGTGGALDFAGSFLAGDDSFIVINVDIIARFNLSGHIQNFLCSDDCCRLLAFPNNSGSGTIRYAGEMFRYCGAATETPGAAGMSTADFIGMTMYRKEFLSLVGPDDFSILPVWQRALDRGMSVSVGLIDTGYWRDIGTPKALAHAHFDVLDGTLDLHPPAGFKIDRKRKVCFPRQWPDLPHQYGDYCWIGDTAFTFTGTVGRTVVFNGAADTEHLQSLQSTLCTPWGAMSFDE